MILPICVISILIEFLEPFGCIYTVDRRLQNDIMPARWKLGIRYGAADKSSRGSADIGKYGWS
jgi:hypothetical protein